MCESNAYLVKGKDEKLLMKDVDVVKMQDDGSFVLETILGERKVINAKLKEINLGRHRIAFE